MRANDDPKFQVSLVALQNLPPPFLVMCPDYSFTSRIGKGRKERTEDVVAQILLLHTSSQTREWSVGGRAANVAMSEWVEVGFPHQSSS